MKMKRLVSMMLAVMLFVAVIPATAFASSSKTVYVSRNGGKIYMRTGPGYDYEAGSTVKHNAKVTVKDTSGKWSKIKVNSTGKTGWIRTMYINGTTKDLGTGYKAIKEATTVYSSYKSGKSKVGKLAKGDTVRVNETEHDYARVDVIGSSLSGWIKISSIGATVDPTPVKPSGKTDTVYCTTASVLNVRSGPGTSYKVINQLLKGTACTVLKSSGNWRKIKTSKGIVGWVSATYLRKQGTAWVATNGGNLNVRKGPGTDYAVLGSLKNGTKVTVKFVTGNWAYVTAGKLTGYVSMNYLKF